MADRMDTQSVINLAIGTSLAAAGWVAKELWDAVKTLQRDLRQLEVEIPKTYVTKQDFLTGIEKIEAICERISDKIDSLERYKADKT